MSPEEQEASLFRIADWLLPTAGARSGREELTDQDRAVLAEATASLGISPFKAAGRPSPKLVELISGELDRILLPPEEEAAARRRLGDRGELAIGDYQIGFKDRQNFVAAWTTLGVKGDQALEAVRKPDRVQHLPAKDVSEEGDRLSLFEKRLVPKAGLSKAFRLLVIATRDKDVLAISSAFRVYESDVNLRGSHKPETTLERFLDVFGMSTSVVGRPFGRLHFYERIEGFTPSANVNLLTCDFAEGDAFVPVCSVRYRQDVLEVGLAFAIDLNKYVPTLRSHGVQVDRNLVARLARMKMPSVDWLATGAAGERLAADAIA